MRQSRRPPVIANSPRSAWAFPHIPETAEHAVSRSGRLQTLARRDRPVLGVFGVILGAVVAWIVAGASASRVKSAKPGFFLSRGRGGGCVIAFAPASMLIVIREGDNLLR